MKKFASIVFALAFVMGAAAGAHANCEKYDVVGITTQDPWTFSSDGQVTYGMAKWYEDDVNACYQTHLAPGYYPYFSGCDFNSNGVVEYEEVLEIYYFVIDYPTGGTPTYAYQCPVEDPCDRYDMVGITTQDPWTFSPDGQVTYGMAKWYEDDVYACYQTHLAPGYYPYFSSCDFNSNGVVEYEEVLEIYYFVNDYPTGGTPAYAYECPGGYDCPANMPPYYDPAPGAHIETSVEWAANGTCNEFYAENGSGQPACTQAQTNNFLADINYILANYIYTNAVFDGYNGGSQTYRRSPDAILCGAPGGPLPAGFYDDIESCWHGAPMNPGSLVIAFDWNVNYYEALDAYLAFVQETYPGGFCEISNLSGAPTGFHATDLGSGWKEWTVRTTANCDFYGCRCDATVKINSDGAGGYDEISVTNNSIFTIYQGMACEDARFDF